MTVSTVSTVSTGSRPVLVEGALAGRIVAVAALVAVVVFLVALLGL
jgi:hypothetical protein